MLAGVVAAIAVGAAILLTGGGILAAVAIGAAAGFWMNVAAGALDNALGGAAGEAVGDWLGPGGVRVLRGIRDAIQIAGLAADAILVGGAIVGAVRYVRGARAAEDAVASLLRGRAIHGKSPEYVMPGVRRLQGSYMDDLGHYYPYDAYYDEYGRLVGRTDYGGQYGYPDPHHIYQDHRGWWTRHHGPRKYNHLPGPYRPGMYDGGPPYGY